MYSTYLFVSERQIIWLEGTIEPETLKVVNNLRITQLIGQSIIISEFIYWKFHSWIKVSRYS